MLRTPVCDLLGIEHPVMQAAIGAAASAELAAAVSNAGGLGSFGAVMATAESVEREVARLRQFTDRPFAINHVVPLLDETAFVATLEVEPSVISFALGDPGDLIARAHAAGAKVIQQIHTVKQAHRAAERGADVIIAQGGEAGGYGLAQGPSSMVLIPQVVDAVAPIPVLAAGGVADGRGLAAALVLGAQGANIGTRFLASAEAAAAAEWKRAVLSAESGDPVRFETWRAIAPASARDAYDAVPRVLRTPFVDTWWQRSAEAEQRADELRDEIFAAMREGKGHALLPFMGQSAGLIHDVQPAAEIVRSIVAEAEVALNRASGAVA